LQRSAYRWFPSRRNLTPQTKKKEVKTESTMKRKLAALAILLASVDFANAAEITHAYRGIDAVDVTISGKIEEGDVQRFNDVQRAIQAKLSEKNITVMLNSPGGHIGTALSIARIVREMKWSTWVNADDECNSACAMIWLGGVKRGATEKSLIGFHGAYDTATKNESGSANAVVGAFYKEIGLSDDAIYFLTMAPPDMAIYLTEESTKKYSIAYNGGLPSEGVIQLLMQTAMNHSKQPERTPEQDNAIVTRVTDNLNLRKDPSPNSVNMMKGLEADYIPAGSEIVFPQTTKCYQDIRTDTIWCPVTWKTEQRSFKGWVRAYYLELNDGERAACVMKNITDHACPAKRVS
jgi:hypothetical protein